MDSDKQRIRHELFDPSRHDELRAALMAPNPELATTLAAIAAAEPEQQADAAEDNSA